MKRLTFVSAALLGATVLMLLMPPAHAARDVGVKIVGVDAVCDSFVVSESSGYSIFTCVPAGGGGGGAPTGCAATVNGGTTRTLTSAGGTATFAASCSSPTSGVTFNWSKNGAFGISTASGWVDTLAANTSPSVANTYNYQVRACSGSACTTVPTTALLVTVPATGGGGGFEGTCPGFDNTRIMVLNWATPTRLYTSQAGGFSTNDILVIQFTTGGVSSTTSLPRIAAAEYQSSPSSRTAVLSATPCDFTTQATPGATIIGNSVTAVFALGTGSGFGYYPQLALNTTYYLNVKNTPSATCTASGACDMFIDLVKPGGL